MFSQLHSAATRQNLDARVLEAYERLRRRQLRKRLCTAVWLGLVSAALSTLGNALFLTDRLAERVLGNASVFVLDLSVLALLQTRLAWRNPGGIAVGYVIALCGCLLYLVSLSPSDLGTLVAPLGCLLVGTALLFPWGARRQAVLSCGAMAGFSLLFFAVAPEGSTEATYNVALALVTMGTLAVATAGILEAHRFETCVHRSRVRRLAIQRRRLIQIGRELRETLDPDVLLPRIAQHARRLVQADLVAIASRDLDGGTLRFTAADGDSSLDRLLGVDLPSAFSSEVCSRLARQEIQISPGAPVDTFLEEFLPSRTGETRLYAAVGPSHRLLGFLSWQRYDGRPFTDLDRVAAEGIADQAYTTLSAARLYARALESGRLKSEFVSTVSHELRTPLSIILGYADMAADPDVDHAERQQSLGGIEQSARELLMLVEHTLDISRMDAGRDHLDLERVDLPSFWRGLAEMCGHLPRREEVELRWPESVPQGALHTDRRRLGIIVRNLVSNALKFTEEGTVEITAQAEGTDLVIQVRDTGIGVAAEDQPVIFEIFRQADGSETRRFQGTGLGLYILSRFVEQLRGTVHLESAVGVGSTFEVRVPGFEPDDAQLFASAETPPLS